LGFAWKDEKYLRESRAENRNRARDPDRRRDGLGATGFRVSSGNRGNLSGGKKRKEKTRSAAVLVFRTGKKMSLISLHGGDEKEEMGKTCRRGIRAGGGERRRGPPIVCCGMRPTKGRGMVSADRPGAAKKACRKSSSNQKLRIAPEKTSRKAGAREKKRRSAVAFNKKCAKREQS